MTNKNPHAKSCIRVYNADEQSTSVKGFSPLKLEGIPQVDSGCSLSLKESYIQVNTPGLYHFTADMVVISKEPVDVQLFINSTPIAGTLMNIPGCTQKLRYHFETEVCISTCRMNHPKVTIQADSPEAKVSMLNFGALKLA